MNKRILIIALTLGVPPAYADLSQYVNSYVGLEGGGQYMDFYESYGHNNFSNRHGQIASYFGLNIKKRFALEYGYEKSYSNRAVKLFPGQATPGIFITTAALHHFETSLKGSYLLGMVNFQFREKLTFFVGLGAARRTIELKDTTIYRDDLGIMDIGAIENSRLMYKKRHSLWRGAIGGQWGLTEQWFLRGRLQLENTSRFRLTARQNNNAQVKLKNAVTGQMGIMYKF